jgi:hypothetical protein
MRYNDDSWHEKSCLPYPALSQSEVLANLVFIHDGSL